jgi:hypothetical protein
LHHGEIWAEASMCAKGLNVIFTLPAVPAEASNEQARLEIAAAGSP